MEDGYVLYMGDDHFAPVHGKEVFCYVYLLHAKDEALDKFRIYKTEVELKQNDLDKTLRTDRGGEYYDPVFFQSVGIIHETTAPYTPQHNGVAERKNRALKEMVNSMLSYSGLSEGFWGEAIPWMCPRNHSPMIALDRQCARAQRRHSLHHYRLLKGGLSGFNLGVSVILRMEGEQ
ncbi:zinc finger, CCHC-type containing protein [Tanacetum coccineum]